MSYKAYKEDSLDLNQNSIFFWDHVVRYWWAGKQAANLDVLDCACGKGYGAFIISQFSSSILGIDLNDNSLKIAGGTFQKYISEKKIQFLKQDIFKLNELDRKFDLITAFEVIEHIPPERTDEFLLSLRGALKPGGMLLISTPNHDVVEKSRVSVPNFHINNFKSIELKKVLMKHFDNVEMLGQFRKRNVLNYLLFTLDVFNLRHIFSSWRKPQDQMASNKSLEANVEMEGESNIFQKLTAEELGRYPEKQFNSYRFSPYHWRQAGLTVARIKKN